MKLLTPFIHFILYSNLWISLAAVTMTAKTIYWLSGSIDGHYPLYVFVFCATLFIYAGHRVVGMRKSKDFVDQGRYKVIAEHKNHIIVYAILGAIGACISIFYLPWNAWLLMALSGLVSMAYIFPVFSFRKGTRLRDIDDVKIYFVALVWTLVTVVLPYVVLESEDLMFLVLSVLEVFLFVFAITIPFDIRDLNVDDHNQVKTIPSRIGAKAAKKWSYVLLLLSFLALNWNIYCHEIPMMDTSGIWFGYLLSYGLTVLLVLYSHENQPDYYYTGYMDGLMILLPIMVIFM